MKNSQESGQINIGSGLLFLLLLLVVGQSSAAPIQDPCRDASQATIAAARDYQKSARTVKSTCTKEGGDCTSSETNADSSLAALRSTHQVMIDACGTTTPPPPPPDSPTMHGDLVITEIMINPEGVLDVDGEWFEIFNPTATDFSLTGITFQIVGTSGAFRFDVTTGFTLPSGSFAVVGKTLDSALTDGVPVDIVGDFSFSNVELPTVRIVNGTVLIDSVDFLNVDLAPAGVSKTLIGPQTAEDNDKPNSWCDSTDSYGTLGVNFGTPGTLASNEIC